MHTVSKIYKKGIRSKKTLSPDRHLKENINNSNGHEGTESKHGDTTNGSRSVEDIDTYDDHNSFVTSTIGCTKNNKVGILAG